MMRYILARTERTIGEIAHFLRAAAVAAIETGEEAINHKTFTIADYESPTERLPSERKIIT